MTPRMQIYIHASRTVDTVDYHQIKSGRIKEAKIRSNRILRCFRFHFGFAIGMIHLRLRAIGELGERLSIK